MANYYANSRTNWFRVKDNSEFETWLNRFEVGYETHIKNDESYYVVLSQDHDNGQFPRYDPDDSNFDEPFDFIEKIAVSHLHNDDIIVMLESGAEKLNFISGIGVAYNSEGEYVLININDIFRKAKARFSGKNVNEFYMTS